MVPVITVDPNKHSENCAPVCVSMVKTLSRTLTGEEPGELIALIDNIRNCSTIFTGRKPVADNIRNVALISEGFTACLPADNVCHQANVGIRERRQRGSLCRRHDERQQALDEPVEHQAFGW